MPKTRTAQSMAALCAVVVLCQPAAGQVRSWVNSVNGLWTDPAKWDPADFPNTMAESAVIARFGSFAVTLPGGQPTYRVGELQTGFGDVALRTDGLGDATLLVLGDATIADHSELQLAEIDGTTLHFDVEGRLRVDPGSSWVVDAADVTTGSLSIASTGSTTETTRVVLRDGATAVLGNVSVAEEASPSRSELYLYGGSSATVDDLMVGVLSDGVYAEVNVEASTLTQGTGGRTKIGVSDPQLPAGRASIAILDGGQVSLGSVEVFGSGRLINAGGSLQIAGELSIAGGSLTESNGATRDFSAVSSIRVSDDGDLSLTGSPLNLSSGQALALDGGALASDGGLVIDGGALTFGSAGLSNVMGDTVLKAGGEVQVAPFGQAMFFGDFVDEGGSLNVAAGASVLFNGDYSGPGVDGAGLVETSGALSPADGIGAATFGGDLFAQQLVVELGGASLYDQVIVAGDAQIADQLVIQLVNPPLGGGAIGDEPFVPAEGDAFTLLTAASLTGRFTHIEAPSLPEGLEWLIDQDDASLTLRVVAAGIPGDFNRDGLVNAADYTVWRDTLGGEGSLMAADANHDNAVTEADYTIWSSAYAPNALTTAVPEPGAAAVLASLLASFALRRRGICPLRSTAIS